MKKYIFPLLAMIVLPLTMTSCFDDEEEVEYSEDCYISAFSLGTLKRSLYKKSSAGLDSIYTTTFTGTYFPMTINQRNLTIENLDSLPIRTRLGAVLTTVSFQGILVWRKANLTEDADTSWTTYSSSDSIDLREPLHFRVVSESGRSSRTYTVKVNVHQQEADSTHWDSLGTAAALTSMAERKALVWKQQIVVVGKMTDGTLAFVKHPCTTAGEWTSTTTSGAEMAVPTTLQQMGGALFMSTTDGQVVTSNDGATWAQYDAPAQEGLTLVGASDEYLYALADGKLYRTSGSAWEEEALDDEGSNLPTGHLNGVYYTMKNGAKRLMLIGSRTSDDKEATVWAKAWREGKETTETWVYYTPNGADTHHCPIMKGLSIVPYDDGMQALGGDLSEILHSYDHGITWKTYDNSDMTADPELQKAAKEAQYLTAAADEESFLWVLVDDRVWRGRINRLGFVRK